MRVVIIGAGEVGTSIAANLSDDHNVVIVDIDEARIETLQYELDVLAIEGDGTSLETLEQAGLTDADLCIACTDDDQVNLVVCGTAKALDEPFTIARTKSVEFLRTWQRNNEAFGADFIVCSDLLSAETIVRVIGLPGAVDVDTFVGGLVHMAEFEIPEESPVTGQTVAEADRFDSLTFAGLFRDDTLLLPTGETVLKPEDRAVVIGSPESIQAFASDVNPNATPDEDEDIVVIGDSEIGYHTANLLEERSFEPRLVAQDRDRARFLSEELPQTHVLEHDPTDTDFLTREHVDKANTVVVAMESDERCLLVSVLLKRIGVDRVIAVVNDVEYVTLFEEIGIDAAVNPRNVTAEEINRFSFTRAAENMAVLENDRAEVLEVEIAPDSQLTETPLEDLVSSMDCQFVVGALARGRSLIPPRGDTKLEPGDHVVFFVETEYADKLMSSA
jgi:trk system potassium uptake protein TrkA